MTRSSRRTPAVQLNRLAAIAAGALALAACSGSESTADDTVVTEPPTTVAETTTTTTSTITTTTTTTVPDTTTTEAPPVIETIPEPESTEPTETTTTEAIPDPSIPVNTTFDPTTVEGEIEQVVLADNEAYKQCLRELPNCDVEAAVRFGEEGYALDRTDRLQGFNDAGWVVDRVDRVTLRVDEVEMLDPAVEAQVLACFEDGSRFTSPDPDGEVFDGFASQQRRYLVALGAGNRWTVAGFETLDDTEGEENNLCG